VFQIPVCSVPSGTATIAYIFSAKPFRCSVAGCSHLVDRYVWWIGMHCWGFGVLDKSARLNGARQAFDCREFSAGWNSQAMNKVVKRSTGRSTTVALLPKASVWYLPAL
jgi:hypothetical protein